MTRSRLDVCQEKNSIEDKLRTKFEHEIKTKLDDLRRSLETEYDERILQCKASVQEDNQRLELKFNEDLHEQTKEFNQEMERTKIHHEKMINELNIELDRLRANGE